jgi:hypothetical protein
MTENIDKAEAEIVAQFGEFHRAYFLAVSVYKNADGYTAIRTQPTFDFGTGDTALSALASVLYAVAGRIEIDEKEGRPSQVFIERTP